MLQGKKTVESELSYWLARGPNPKYATRLFRVIVQLAAQAEGPLAGHAFKSPTPPPTLGQPPRQTGMNRDPGEEIAPPAQNSGATAMP